ncbi:hypothetical protein ASPZODRAFT_20928 [Penicilliopsis zonata CBS 506.65]|uniref:Uncharacterized protein n=1 Tax=Penicilliopsis zonata CBS 506.65 TaxID=1073090 RepID=A0A1L9S499_9EURO|nr:hypothetical protein ASPZODRAFT_20928 [Penicilliopsis zonata CBS 506.65]OJJ41991.1 hypothetical protein ASPZODRAFT_20928 [Penicilliopsis zonata CBS 506.65]
MAGMEAGIPRNLSRASSIRRAAREEQDLRKVASLHQHQHHQHHARQPVQEYPREYMETLGPRVVRAASYAYVDRGAAPDRARYYDEPAAAGYSRRLVVPAEEAPVSPRYRETYYEEEPAGRIMAPPPPQRRIVVDVHGNQYYETVAAPRMQTMVPGVATRLTKGDVYEEHVPMRAASVRAASIIDDAYGGERRYVQEMPPPPPTYRRVPVVDYTRPAGSEQPHHQQAPPPPHHYIDERDTLIRPGSVQVGEYAVRRSYVDEPHDLGRERVVRVSSVRPTHTHAHEESREGVQRIASVRPGGREVSTYVDEDPRRPREYIERAVYLTSARGGREERYLEAGEEGLDESRDVRRIRRY